MQTQENIDKYFSQMATVALRLSEAPRKGAANADVFASRFNAINKLSEAFTAFERKETDAYRKIGLYLGTVNSFFRNSGKEVLFEEKSNELVFRFLGTGEEKNIGNLSSGERQILILLSFIAFEEHAPSVLIVDEPEISLHPRWQQGFVEAMLGLIADGTQIILATHSPEIVGRNQKSCIVLSA